MQTPEVGGTAQMKQDVRMIDKRKKSSELKLRLARTTSSGSVSAPALTPRFCMRCCRQIGLHPLPQGLGMRLQN